MLEVLTYMLDVFILFAQSIRSYVVILGIACNICECGPELIDYSVGKQQN